MIRLLVFGYGIIKMRQVNALMTNKNIVALASVAITYSTVLFILVPSDSFSSVFEITPCRDRVQGLQSRYLLNCCLFLLY